MSPFLSVQQGGKFNEKVWFDIDPRNNNGPEIVPQLIGNIPQHFVDTMRFLHDKYGYERFNINLGCPSSKVLRHKRGCALLADSARVMEILETVAEKTDFKVSLKMRIGLKSEDEGLELIRRIEGFPLDFVAIHPRLGKDLYSGEPDWNAFERLCESTSQRVVYSGDIFDADTAHRLRLRFPYASALMLGRGMLQNPFLAEEIKGSETPDRNTRFAAFYDDYVDVLLQVRTKQGTLSILKELWHYFARFCKLGEDELAVLLRTLDLETFLANSRRVIHEMQSCR